MTTITRIHAFAVLVAAISAIVVVTNYAVAKRQVIQHRSHRHLCIREMVEYDVGNPGRCK